MQQNTTRDVWLEILENLRISISDDEPKDIQLKRRTLLSVALICKDLEEIAIDELWKSMETLEPVSSIFNPEFKYRENQDHAFWDISESTRGLNSSLPRVQIYLSRIYFLHFSTFPSSRELALWLPLLGLGKLSYLCPNLRGLYLDLEQSTPNVIYNLCCLLTPSIEVLSLTSVKDSSTNAIASSILAMLQHVGTKIEAITYNGTISLLTFHHLFNFRALRSITIGSYTDTAVLDKPQIAGFSAFSNLTTLDICLRVVIEDALPVFGLWLSQSTSVTTLRVVGTWIWIKKFLFNPGISFVSLQSLSLSFTFTRNPALRGPSNVTKQIEPQIFKLISVASPNLKALYIETKNFFQSAWRRDITLEDVLNLGCGGIEVLSLRSVKAAFDDRSIALLVEKWHQLRSLSISPFPDNQTINARRTLMHISQHGRSLQKLCLLLHDIHSLVEASTSISPAPVCPLQHLELWDPTSLPSDLEDQHRFIRNLVNLFPRLKIITSPQVVDSAEISNLQKILRFTRDIIYNPPVGNFAV